MRAESWRHLAANVPLLASSVIAMAREDPAHLAVQIVRRTPYRVRDLLSGLPTPAGPLAGLRPLWLLMLDRTRELREDLERSPEKSSALLDTLRLQVGAEPGPDATPRTWARAAWAAGDAEEALMIAAAGAAEAERDRIASQLRILTPGRGIVLGGAEATGARHTLAAPRPEPDRPIRVLHVLTNSRPWTTSGYALRSHAVLLAQREAGLEVTAATRLAYPVTIGRAQAGPVDLVDGIAYRRLLPRRLPRLPDQRLLLHARMLGDLALTELPDVLHTTTNFHNALVTDAVSRALGLPWVYEMRGELEKSWVARRPRNDQGDAEHSRRYALMRSRETEMARRADAVVVLSRVQRDSMIRRGVDPARLVIVPNAVDESLLEVARDPEGARADLGLAAGFRIGTVSALVDYEGLDTLVRAIADLRSRGRIVRASLVGDGVSREDLLRLAEDLGVSDLVDLPGRVAPERALAWYRALDVMVIPRRDSPVTRAVTPIKGLQAMALGIPQIVSDLPALTEVGARDGQGLIVPPEDVGALTGAIQRLAGDAALRTTLSEAARAAARTRTWRANGQVYQGLYEKLRGQPRTFGLEGARPPQT